MSYPPFIRPSRSNDYPCVAAIYNEAIATGNATMDREPSTARKFADMVAKFGDRERLLVCETDKVIGWGKIARYSDRLGYSVCCETSVYLAQTETGKGYGSILQKEILKTAAKLNYHHVVAKILAANSDSIRFHQKFGFELVGIQKEIGFFSGQWHDVAIMQLIFPEIAPALAL